MSQSGQIQPAHLGYALSKMARRPVKFRAIVLEVADRAFYQSLYTRVKNKKPFKVDAPLQRVFEACPEFFGYIEEARERGIDAHAPHASTSGIEEKLEAILAEIAALKTGKQEAAHYREEYQKLVALVLDKLAKAGG